MNEGKVTGLECEAAYEQSGAEVKSNDDLCHVCGTTSG